MTGLNWGTANKMFRPEKAITRSWSVMATAVFKQEKVMTI